MSLVPEEFFELDNVMFWEFFRWERFNTGWVYIQRFPNNKLYAGQSINIKNRVKNYNSGYGSNKHHTNALREYKGDIKIVSVVCPRYVLDTIETFLIEFYDLLNPSKGYNKSSGGRRGWYASDSTRELRSLRSKEAWEQNPQRRTTHSELLSGKKHTEESIQKMKKPKKESTKLKMRKPKTDSHRSNISKGQEGIKNNQAKPVFVFGRIYSCMQDASNELRPIFNLKKKNFIKAWRTYKCYENEIFDISKDTYDFLLNAHTFSFGN
ncbi:GIY-YIG catalytic domain-containing endonuclease [Acanthocystis turfacea Chlorella virus TN603.4.2]|nr:GIY-YIG catalytic domain-containing endonuclease [Acanthocystis turfacea Chlorella virus TN603.4.2]